MSNTPDAGYKTTNQAAIACIVLAAGLSRRFGSTDKLLAEIDGSPIIHRTVHSACLTDVQTGALKVYVVTPPKQTAPKLGEALMALDVEIIENPNHKAGIGSSISAGIQRLPESVVGALILPGDMPFMTATVLTRLTRVFWTGGARRVIVPVTALGEQRNPVLWPRAWFPKLRRLNADKGAKSLIPGDPADRRDIVIEHEDVFRDIDRPMDLPS